MDDGPSCTPLSLSFKQVVQWGRLSGHSLHSTVIMQALVWLLMSIHTYSDPKKKRRFCSVVIQMLLTSRIKFPTNKKASILHRREHLVHEPSKAIHRC